MGLVGDNLLKHSVTENTVKQRHLAALMDNSEVATYKDKAWRNPTIRWPDRADLKPKFKTDESKSQTVNPNSKTINPKAKLWISIRGLETTNPNSKRQIQNENGELKSGF